MGDHRPALKISTSSTSPTSSSLVGKIFEPTKEQLDAVDQLKWRLRDFEWEDEVGVGRELEKLSNEFYLFQWLKSVNLNVDKAESALRKSFQWRKKNRISTVIDDFPLDAAKEFPFYMDSFTRDGKPVGSFTGNPQWQLRRFVESDPDGGKKFVRYCALKSLAAENIWLRHNTKIRKGVTTTQPPENWNYIGDTSKSSLWEAASPKTVRSAIQALKDIATYFPPMVDRMIFLNVSTTASIILKIIRPFLTFARIDVHDRDEKKWKKALSEFIELEELRPEFGGTKSN